VSCLKAIFEGVYLFDKGNIDRETFPKLVQYGEESTYPFYGLQRTIDSIKYLREAKAELVSIELTYLLRLF
jgi:hypothetical protein